MLRTIKNHSLASLAIVGLMISFISQPQIAQSATQVSQYGITWKFDKDYQVGQFANGDYWVVGPVTITSITPPSVQGNGTLTQNGNIIESGRIVNGAMINPSPKNVYKQGYDTLVHPTPSTVPYVESLNVARKNNAPLSRSNVLTVQPGSSMLSVISRVPRPPVTNQRSKQGLSDAAVLTVLSSAPPTGSFRPAYSGSNKNIPFNANNINFDLFSNLPKQPMIGKNVLPTLHKSTLNDPDDQEETIERMFQRVWIDHYGSDPGEMFMSALHNQHNYGREISTQVGIGALMLNLDFTDEEKRTLLIYMVQQGIDAYGVLTDTGGYGAWKGEGGHNSGRFPLILLAGLVMNNEDMKTIGLNTLPNGGTYHFGEIDQTFYVEETSPGVYNLGYGGYTAADVGLPDWSQRHWWALFTPWALADENRAWVVSYRQCCTANSWAGFILASHIMGIKERWHHNAIFDYMDRYMDIQLPLKGTGDNWTRQQSKFNEEMWDTYRANYGCVWTRTNPNDTYSNGSLSCDTNEPPPTNLSPNADAGPNQNLTDADNNGSEPVTLNGSNSSDPDGSIVSYAWTEGGSPIATGARPTVSLSVGQHIITLRVTDNGGLPDTDTVVITIEALASDTTPPSIISVAASENTVEIQFSEPLDEQSATDSRNYSLSGGVTINSVWLDTIHNRVVLYTSTHQQGVNYTLTVANVKDIAGNAISSTTRSYIFTQGLVGYWIFDEVSDNSIIDISGNNNTAAIINGVTVTAAGEAAFTSSRDAVQIPTAGLNAAQGTVSLWAKPSSSQSGSQYLFGHTAGGWANRIQLYLDNGNLCVGLGDTHLLNTNIQLLSTQTWYHIALSWNGTNYVVYVNGEIKATGTYSGLSQLNTIADIGNTGYTAARNEGFNGLIDEVRVYNRPITTEELDDLSLDFLPIGDKTVVEGNQLSFSVRTRPGITVNLTHNLPGAPSFTSNMFSWTPNYEQAGIYEANFTSGPDYELVTITVVDSQTLGSIGYWAFDETTGDIAPDSSTSNNTGYLKNGLDWGSGRINGAVVLSVPNDAVEISTANMNINTGTIAMWVYMEKQTLSRHYLFGHAGESLDNRIQLYLKYGNLCVGLGNSHETAKNIYQMQKQTWYHITLTWNAAGYRVYVNGAALNIGTFSGLSGFSDYADIGNNGIFRDKALNGKIDDVRIYNRALSSAEIAQLAEGN